MTAKNPAKMFIAAVALMLMMGLVPALAFAAPIAAGQTLTTLAAGDLDDSVESIEYKPAFPIVLFENDLGFWDWDESFNRYFYYTGVDFENRDILTVTYASGDVKDYTCEWRAGDDGQGCAVFVSENGEEIRGNEGDGVQLLENQYENHWALGNQNRVEIRYGDKSFMLPITVVKALKSIELTPVSDTVNIPPNTQQDKFWSLAHSSTIAYGSRLVTVDADGVSHTYRFDPSAGKYMCRDDSSIPPISESSISFESVGELAIGSNEVVISYGGARSTIELQLKQRFAEDYAEVQFNPDVSTTIHTINNGSSYNETIYADDGKIIGSRFMRLDNEPFLFFVYPNNDACEVDKVTYTTKDGHTSYIASISNPDSNRGLAYQIPALQGLVTIGSTGKLRSGVTVTDDGVINFNGITDSDGNALPNASKLTIGVGPNVRFSHVDNSGKTKRGTITLPRNWSPSSVGSDVYVWPDSTTTLVFQVPESASVEEPQLTPGAGEIVSWDYAADSASLTVSLRLSKPATLLVGGKADQVIAVSDVKKTYGAAPFALGAKLTAGDGELSYSSSNTAVAAIDASGKVTIKGAGTAKITVKAGETAGFNAASKIVTVTVAKAANPLKLANAKRTVKAAKIKKTKQVVKGVKVKAKGQGKITYSISKVAKSKFKKRFSINKTTGKITVKKGTKKGSYKITVKVTAAGNANYNKSAAKTSAVTIKVK